MLEPGAADLVASGITAAVGGNRQLARLHFERAVKLEPVNPLVWLWMAWTATSPQEGLLHLKKIQAGPFAEFASAGAQWLAALNSGATSSPGQETDSNEAGLSRTSVPNRSSLDKLQCDRVEQANGIRTVPTIVTLPTGSTKETLPSTDSPTEPVVSTDPTLHSDTGKGPIYSLGCPSCRGRLRIWGKLIGPLHQCPGCRAVFVAEANPENPQRPRRRLLSTINETQDLCIQELSISSLEKPFILVLDDRESRRQLMLNVLNRAGYRVGSAANLDEVASLLGRQKPRLILIDGNMKAINGLEACKKLRLELSTKTIPILLMSTRTDFFDQVQARLAGCSAYVTKPCDADHLLSKINDLLQFDHVTDNTQSDQDAATSTDPTLSSHSRSIYASITSEDTKQLTTESNVNPDLNSLFETKPDSHARIDFDLESATSEMPEFRVEESQHERLTNITTTEEDSVVKPEKRLEESIFG